MGLYINMEMPTGYSALTLKVWPDGQVEIIDADGEWKTSEAIPVQEPHGRLGDLDRLNEEVHLLIKENMFSRNDARDLLETIAYAPTVIPASGEGE